MVSLTLTEDKEDFLMSDKEKLTALISEAMYRGAKPGTIAGIILDAGYRTEPAPVNEHDLQRDPGDEDDSLRRAA